MTNYLHEGDLPADVTFQGDIAVDSEAMGLIHLRDRLCVIQLSDGQGDAHLVRFEAGVYNAPNLTALLTDPARVKMFHFARFDVAIIKKYMGITVNPIYCTKIASKLARTYTDRHGFKDLCKEILGRDISKQQQSSDWGADTLSQEQIDYAASDVLYLHQLRERLNMMLEREGRMDLALRTMACIPVRAELDVLGWENMDIFAHA